MADILILSAHPDDGDFGMGGTLLKLAKRYKVAHVILTRGEAGTYGTPEEREREAKDAGRLAGCSVEFLDFKDNHVEDTAESAKILAEVIRKHKPRLVFAPYHTNDSTHTDGRAHPDHLALGRLALKACRFAKFKNASLEGERHTVETIIYYMTPSYLQPSFVLDVSDVVPQMQALWGCYKTQLNIAEGRLTENLLFFRKAVGMANGFAYGEAFIVQRSLKVDDESIMKI
jgi:LmbE family N-acetylglucosaminyl deacetylase